MISVGSKWTRRDYTRIEAIVARVEANKVYVTYPASPKRAAQRFGMTAFGKLFVEAPSDH